MSRPEVLAFLQDIKEHPDDDTPRLILADWLCDHGDEPRGEFLRLQCQLARLPVSDPTAEGIRQRIQELQIQHQYQWVEGLVPYAEVLRFHRGLLQMTTDAQQLRRKELARLTGEEPLAWVETIQLAGVTSSLPSLARLPVLEQIVTLNLSGLSIDDRTMEALVTFPSLARLLRLDLSDTQLGQRGMAALASAGGLRHLTGLTWRMSWWASVGLQTLTQGTLLRQLTQLDLSGNIPFRTEVFDALVQPPYPLHLIKLRLANVTLLPQSVIALASSTSLPELQILDLSGCQISDVGATSLANWWRLSKVRHLDLSRNQIGHLGVKTLLATPSLRGLSVLDLRDNYFGSVEAKKLRAHFGEVVVL